MWEAGAAIDFVTRHYVQGERVVYYGLFQQDEAALR